MNESFRRQETLFSQALALPAEERPAYLEKTCGSDVALRRQIEELLKSAAESNSTLSRSALPTLFPNIRHREIDAPGLRIGRYTLKEKLGEGGAGVVYVAEQEEPIHRQVALKLVKPSLNTAAAVARFEAERQALALMDHPNIARVFDADATAEGRLFFAMELVRGVKITEYCDRHHLSLTQRIELFAQVGRAVQHAHQKGIIHRDLKPSNILVTVHDGRPIPKIIDFGIAKARQGHLAEQTLVTMADQFMGTPAYMSPEQAEWGAADVDTRSDLYSLGAILYELLTGGPPLEAAELQRLGLDAMRAAIRERDAVRPSARVKTLTGDRLTEIARDRRIEPSRLSDRLRGDLDSITLKCLEKDRNRRYATASELVSELERHLHDEPVLARAPNPAYQIIKFIRRHRTAAIATGAVGAILVAASAVSIALAVRATRAEHRMQRVGQVFRGMLDGLGQTHALTQQAGLDRGSKLWRGILDQTAERALHEVRGDPEIETELEQVFGKIYLASGNYDRAEPMLRSVYDSRRAALGLEHPKTAEALFELGSVVWMMGRAREGDVLIREALTIRRRVLGPEHPETVKTLELLAMGTWVMGGDFVGAEPLFREALEIRRRTGRLEEIDNAQVSPRQGLAQCLLFLGRYPEGEALARENLASVTQRLDPNHRLVSEANMVLGWALNKQSKCAEARPYCEAAVAIDRATLDPDHPSLANSLYELATCLDKLGDPEAERLYRETLSIWRSRRASSAPRDMLHRLNSLAAFLAHHQRFREAVPYFDEAWEISTKYDYPNCVEARATSLRGAIEAHQALARIDATNTVAVALWEERLARFENDTKVAPPCPHRTNAVRGLAATYADWAGTDPTKTERAGFWREELARCEQAVAGSKRDIVAR